MQDNIDTTTEDQNMTEIEVDPDEIITGLRYNGEEAAHARSRTARFEIRDGEATLQYHEQGSYYPAGQGPDFIIKPSTFVCEGGRVDGIRKEWTMYPTRGTIRAEVKTETDADSWDDIDEGLVDEWHEEAVDVWEGEVRNALVDEIVVRTGVDADGEIHERLAVEYVED